MHPSCIAVLTAASFRSLRSAKVDLSNSISKAAHPAATFVHYSVDDMKEILDLGATFLEHTWNDVTRQVSHPLQISVLFDVIKAVGPAHCIMSTDAGQWLNPPAAQQMGIYIKEALKSGISAQDVRRMVSDNPAKILGI